jgi:hypothetical protein
MAVCFAKRAMALVISNLLCAAGTAAANAQVPDVAQNARDIVAACGIERMIKLEESLSAKLEEFLRRSNETKSAKAAALTEIFAQMPIDDPDILEQEKDPRGRQMFFSFYFKCIGAQTNLKLKSLNIAVE